MDQLEQIKQAALKDLENLRDLATHELARVQHLGRGSKLSEFLRSLKDMTEDDRRKIGAAANDLRKEIEEKFTQAREKFSDATHSVRDWIDVTMPSRRPQRGHLHPLTIAQNTINNIFSAMGFRIIEGPEIETEFNNFDALNIPADHPARDMQDTFWLKKDERRRTKDEWPLLLRAHTSPMQIRFMQVHQPPFRIIVPGRVYRNEATDATHEFQFRQTEGLVVDRKGALGAPTLANLKGVLEYFFRQYFADPNVAVRFNASYFPFVEPGVEVLICGSKGKFAGKWIEVAGAGMVHQKVFEKVGYAHGEMQGFAFGMALERLVMLKHHIDDIRLFNESDLRFLKQFS